MHITHVLIQTTLLKALTRPCSRPKLDNPKTTMKKSITAEGGALPPDKAQRGTTCSISGGQALNPASASPERDQGQVIEAAPETTPVEGVADANFGPPQIGRATSTILDGPWSTGGGGKSGPAQN